MAPALRLQRQGRPGEHQGEDQLVLAGLEHARIIEAVLGAIIGKIAGHGGQGLAGEAQVENGIRISGRLVDGPRAHVHEKPDVIGARGDTAQEIHVLVLVDQSPAAKGQGDGLEKIDLADIAGDDAVRLQQQRLFPLQDGGVQAAGGEGAAQLVGTQQAAAHRSREGVVHARAVPLDPGPDLRRRQFPRGRQDDPQHGGGQCARQGAAAQIFKPRR